MLLSLLTACGQLEADTGRRESGDRDLPEAEAAGGAGRVAATVAPEAPGGAGGRASIDRGGEGSGVRFVHPCGFEYVQPPCGEWQVETDPDGLEFSPDAAACVIPLEFDLGEPNIVQVLVNCTVVLYCEEPELECWAFDDRNDPTAVVLNDSLCERLGREGVTVVDILAGCHEFP